MWRKCDIRELLIFVGITHRLWQRRNEFIIEGAFSHPTSIFEHVVAGVEAFGRAQGFVTESTNAGSLTSSNIV